MMTNNKNLGVFRLYPLIPLLLIGAVVVMATTFRTSYYERYKIFRSNARSFAINVNRAGLHTDRHRISLLELIDAGYHNHILNPFLGDRHCDINDSFITIRGPHLYTTLRCGNYLINDQDVGARYFAVYRIIVDWQETWPGGRREDIDTMLMYNFQIDNELVYERFFPEEVFVYKFNRRNNTEYENVDDIPIEFNVIERRFYRLRKFVDNIDA